VVGAHSPSFRVAQLVYDEEVELKLTNVARASLEERCETLEDVQA
jgi:hypothetical protein